MSLNISTNSATNPVLGSPVAAPEPREGGEQTSVARRLRDTVFADFKVSGDAGFRGLAEKLRQKLERGISAADIQFSLDLGLEQIGKALRRETGASEEVSAALDSFRSQLAAAVNELADEANPAAASSNAVAAREVVKNRFSLDVLTAEGDRVSIRFRSREVTSAAFAQVSNESGTASAANASVLSRGRISIEVKGDLNADELAAINNLLDEVDSVATQFFGGDVQAAFAAAGRVGIESDTLSAFSLRLSYSRSVSLAQRYTEVARLPIEPASPEPATSSGAPISAPVTEELFDPTPVVPESSVVAEVPASESPSAADAAPVSARDTISSFTKAVLARLASVDADATQFSLRWRVDFLVNALSAAAPAADPEAPAAVDTLGQSLESQVPVEVPAEI